MPPINSFTVTRRNLPHWQNPGSTYFLTWRVTGVPILEPEDRTIALDAIRHWADLRWRLYAAVIMPDHAHALARPLPVDPARPTAGAVYDLSELIASVKKFSALRINRRRGRQGTLWQDERHDHIVRDDREFEETWTYIRYNPVKAGLVETPEQYPWLYEATSVD